MRIIRKILALIMLSIILLAPISVLADDAQTEDSNEVKNNSNNQEKVMVIDGISKDSHDISQNVSESFEGYVEPETKLDKDREQSLLEFSEKHEKGNFSQNKFTVNASAYTAAEDECGKSDGITASGLKVKENETIACPAQYPFGTKIKISGMGTYVCEDRGGAIKGNHIDIYVKTKKEAFEFGRQKLEAEVVTEEA